ncbi:MAG: type IX secretion system protein PorQ [Prevotella sp.]|nr:type IX secretion system protein PorQ [Prevotella sp.]
MKKGLLAIVCWLLAISAYAQESQEVYSFLRLPVSAHVAALGGDNVSLTNDDATVIFHNPALITDVSDKTLNVNFMTYMEGSTTASASFVRAYKERGSWGISAQYMSYGEIKETTAANQQTGTFSPKDIALAGSFAYLLSNRISGGITARFISSTIGSYSSAAVAVDLGLNYQDTERGWSVSAVARNLGGQVKAYEEEFERIPFDLLVGVSRQLPNAPLTLHATLARLNNWDQAFIKHLAVGADIRLSPAIYVSAGYNFRRSSEMKIYEGEDTSASHGAGLSLGGGIELERLKLNIGYAKYHVSASSLLVNVAYTL